MRLAPRVPMSVGFSRASPHSFEAPSRVVHMKGTGERSICLSEDAKSKVKQLSAKGISLSVVSIFQTLIGRS